MLGKLIGANGKYNSGIAANIAKGKMTPIEDLKKIWKDDPRNLPRAVEAPILDDIPAWKNPFYPRTLPTTSLAYSKGPPRFLARVLAKS